MVMWRRWSLVGLLLAAGCSEPQAQNGANPPVPTAPGQALPKSDPNLVDADAPEEFTTTASGLKYRIRRKSDGRKPTAENDVVAHYKGWLDDGTVFDSSYDRGEPATFPLSQVVGGWTEGLQLIGEGGMIELEIPSDLGYGAGGRPPKIPGGATLHFTVELMQVQ